MLSNVTATLATLAFLVIPHPSAAQTSAKIIPGKWRVTDETIGCQSNSDLKTLTSLVATNNRAASVKFVTAKRASGACKLFKNGPVVLEKGSYFSSPCARRQGEAGCWFLAPAKLIREDAN